MMSDEQRTYVSYLLRLWQEPIALPSVWRASLENPQTGELLGFGDVAQLFAFLEHQIANGPHSAGALHTHFAEARSAQGGPDTNRRQVMYAQSAVSGQIDTLELQRPGTSVASITDAASREWAARLVKEGACVASFVRSVWVLWIDPSNRDAVEAIYRIKGERRIGRPISTTLGAERFVEMLDPEEIDPRVRKIFLDPRELEQRFGMLCLIRAPIRKSAAQVLPPDVLSQTADGTNWLQNCIITGSSPAIELIQAIQNQGVEFPAVTSMNVSGQPEIADRDQAEVFCREHGIPLVLTTPEDKHVVQGSFPIIEVNQAGVKLVREGHFSPYLYRYLLDGAEVKLSGAVPGKFPLISTHSEEEAARAGANQLREEIIARLEGRG